MTQDSKNGNFTQLIAQWITSLAISVICCAILFVVFASYILNVQNDLNIATVRIEVLQEKNAQLSSEMDFVRRRLAALPAPPQIGQAPEAATAPAAPSTPPASGVEITEPAPPEPMNPSGAESREDKVLDSVLSSGPAAATPPTTGKPAQHP